jgi:pimeloyl-ACP methyl ester carboxylesterase
MVTLPHGGRVQVYDNYPVSGSAAVTRAVIVVHGTSRDANGYYTHMMNAATQAGVTNQTMVLAPHFEVSGDTPAGTLTWPSNEGWKQGDTPTTGVSSFTVIDQLIGSLADPARFPHLTHITLAGHSAGGQFTQRYAAFGAGVLIKRRNRFLIAISSVAEHRLIDTLVCRSAFPLLFAQFTALLVDGPQDLQMGGG